MVDVALPAYRSRVFTVEPRIYAADRDNVLTDDITRAIIDVGVDADIDRSGAKSQLQIAAISPDYIKAGSWVAPFLDVRHEDKTVQSSQMGLFRLHQGNVTFDRTGPAATGTTGADIIEMLEMAVMSEADTVPVGSNIMSEVRRAVELATCGGLGPNLLTNPGFDTDIDGWSSGWSSGGVGTFTHNDLPPYGSLRGVGRLTCEAASTAGGYGYIYQSFIPVPAGARYAMMQARSLCNLPGVEIWTSLRFMQDGGTRIGPLVDDAYITEAQNQWRWHRAWHEIPEGTDYFLIYCFVRAIPGSGVVTRWDDVSLQIMGHPPLTRHAFPDDPREASTPISHQANTKWLTRINDMLRAIGYYGAHATNDGRPTSRPLRDIRRDTPARTYVMGWDSEIVDPIQIDESTGNLYNKVVAVKEDFQTGDALVAVAVNDDPDDPWSTVNMGEIAPTEPVTVSDAVSQSELQAIADEKLARASKQETLTMSLLPDPFLTIYDLIEVVAAFGPESGIWANESIAWGMTANSPLVEIGARRTYSRSGGGE